MTSHIRERLHHGAPLLCLCISAAICGCSTVKPSTEYLKNLQQAAMRGDVQAASIDVAQQCPTCAPNQIAFGQKIVDAERQFSSGCKGMPGAEANYRTIKAMMQPDNSLPDYETFVTNRMCEVAEKYQTCAAPEHRQLPPGDSASPAAALIVAVDECREQNPAEADEILNRAIAQESEFINRELLSDDYPGAKRELRIYAALPRSNKQRAQEWRNTIASEESAAKASKARTSAELKAMVCDESYFIRNPDTGYGMTVGGLNMRHGGRIGSGNPFEPISKTDTKETRMATLIWEISNVDEVSMTDAQMMLQNAYAHAAKDPSYCGTPD